MITGKPGDAAGEFLLQEFTKTKKKSTEDHHHHHHNQPSSSKQHKTEKPKLVLHVGPRKTGTTTIQGALFASHEGTAKYFKSQLEQDKFKMILTTWNDGRDLVHYLNGLSSSQEGEGGKKEYKKGRDVYESIQQQLKRNLWNNNSTTTTTRNNNHHIALSNEALPSLLPTVETKKALLELTRGYTVIVSMVYRPLASLLVSLYNEERRVNVRQKDFDGIDFATFGNEFGEVCQEELPKYYAKIGETPEFGDPLTTYDTFRYFFGTEHVKVHQLYHPQNIDITEQFVCDAMQANVSCQYVRERGPPEKRNDGTVKEKFKFDEDLIVFEAQRRGIYQYSNENPKCKRALRRKDHALFVKQQLASKYNKTINDLSQLCIQHQELDKLYQRAWESERTLSLFPRDKKVFDQEFWNLEQKQAFCSVHLDTVLKDPMMLNVLHDERICVKEVWRKLEYGRQNETKQRER